MEAETLQGSACALILYDACEEFRLEEVRRAVSAHEVDRGFKHAAPEYVRFERPPVVEEADTIVLSDGERANVQVKYYHYGVVSIVFSIPFRGDWCEWIELSARWIYSNEFEQKAVEIARNRVGRLGTAAVKLYKDWLSEDYFIFNMTAIPNNPSGSALLSSCAKQITQIVRGETAALADTETNEVRQSSLSYYPTDLAVVGWHAAYIYDSSAGAQATIQLLEYANSQLLEFRHYDELLTRELTSAYDFLEKRGGALGRWTMARRAGRLQRVTVEVTELTERVDNAIKFLSDMFSARLYKLAAEKVGVNDYESLVDQKLRAAGSLNSFMVGEFYQARAFVLELMVVVILVIELVF
ncbi:MAG: hypothetical protein JOY79_05585, partial [Acidobacteriaceae bacterium]|nr:hypothetical protein [Acidobacteriaceae bacterium]